MDIPKLTLAKGYDPERLREIVRHEFHVTASIHWLDLAAIGGSVCAGFLLGVGIIWLVIG